MIERLHYITQDGVKGFNHPELAEKACLGGAKCVVLRAPRRSYASLKVIALETQKVCKKHNTLFIICANVMLAKEIGANGVQLGIDDMPIDQARMILGKDFLIGGAANNYNDIVNCDFLGADYVYLGPFSYTNSYYRKLQTLGFSGYRRILAQVKNNPSLNIPIIAKGGIDIDDIPFLTAMGINGVAVSTAINNGDPATNTYDFIEELSNPI